MTLAILATEDNWQAFDESWNELLKSQGPIDDLLQALEIASAKRKLVRCLGLVREHAQALVGAERPQDAALILGTALRYGAPTNEVGDLLFGHAQTAWGAETWWNPFTELSGFRPGAPDLRKAWVYFDDMRSYGPGVVVFHRGGWGTGEVLELNHTELEVSVRFLSGKLDRFPLRTAVDIFERLPEHDLRAQHLKNPEGLRTRLQKEPIEVLRSVLLRHHGRATQMMIKNALLQVGIDGSAWTNWWKKARMQAENSEWFRVSGSGAKIEIELLRRAIDPIAGVQRQLDHAPTLGVALSRARDLFAGSKIEAAQREAVLAVLERLVGNAKADFEERLSTWMFLREHRGTTPVELAELVKRSAAEPLTADTSTPSKLWVILQHIPLVRDQERSVELLKELYGPGWLDEAGRNLQHAPAGLVKPVIDALLAEQRNDELAATYNALLARPMRAPFALMALIRLAEDGKIVGEFPGPVQRASAFLELAAWLHSERRGNTLLARAEQRLLDLLTKGDPPLLRKLLVDVDVASLRAMRGALNRGVEEKLDALVGDISLEHGLDLFKGEATPFWEEDKIWTTRGGLERRQAELRDIREVKLPANSEAIGRAAAYGDLSENSEWEQAIENQRHLTEQAAAIERELRQAALLENAPLPEDTVAPGTQVRYREIESGELHEVWLLGPWDSHLEKAISYRAPLAAGMLGLKIGARSLVQLPGGHVEVEILGVKPSPVH